MRSLKQVLSEYIMNEIKFKLKLVLLQTGVSPTDVSLRGVFELLKSLDSALAQKGDFSSLFGFCTIFEPQHVLGHGKNILTAWY